MKNEIMKANEAWRGVQRIEQTARKGDTPEYVNKMQQGVFDVLALARSLEELQRVEPKAREVRVRYLEGLVGATARELAIRRRVSRLNYSRRCAEASAVQAHMNQGLPLAPGMEIGYVVKDAKKWEVDPERTASDFDAAYYQGLLKKAWGEAAFVFGDIRELFHTPSIPDFSARSQLGKGFLG